MHKQLPFKDEKPKEPVIHRLNIKAFQSCIVNIYN